MEYKYKQKLTTWTEHQINNHHTERSQKKEKKQENFEKYYS